MTTTTATLETSTSLSSSTAQAPSFGAVVPAPASSGAVVPAPASSGAVVPATISSGAFARGVVGAPRLVLRVEAALVLVASLLAYRHLGGSWGWFAALFLLPDLSMLGYLAGPRVGAAAYNTAHSYLAPALLAAASLALGAPSLLLGAAIWTAHIGFDRMLGYGLKYGTAFGDTHLGRVGGQSR
jgi:hypothetical protein